MNIELAREITENWNGEDRQFLYNGEIYHEDDVYEAEEFIEAYEKHIKKQEINYKLAFISLIGIIVCIITALILNPK